MKKCDRFNIRLISYYLCVYLNFTLTCNGTIICIRSFIDVHIYTKIITMKLKIIIIACNSYT